MPSPFPGMDPYLETPELWPDVHHELISQIRSVLNPNLRPRYVARVELRVYISDEDDPGREVIIPDLRIEQTKRQGAKKSREAAAVTTVEPLLIPLLIDNELEEARLEIREQSSGTLVTIIELLSPTNKIRGARGRTSFLEKRQDALISDVHWVELDLLRGGTPSVRKKSFQACDYRLLVSRAGRRHHSQFWPVSVRQPFPVLGIPLRGDDPDVPLDLNVVLAAAYEHGAYDLSVDYRREPDPPLPRADKTWANHLLKEKGLR